MLVPAVSMLPCFNDPLIVAMNKKGGVGLSEEEKSVGKEFEAHCFCPPDVVSVSIPVWLQHPCPPLSLYANADSDGGAGIGECLYVYAQVGVWYGCWGACCARCSIHHVMSSCEPLDGV